MCRKNNLSFIVLCGILCQLDVCAQNEDFETYRKQMHEDYGGFVKQHKEDFEAFRAKANAEYADFVRRAWVEMKGLQPIPRPKDEKPVPPVVMPEEEKDKPVIPDEMPIEEVIETPKPQPQPQPVVPIEEKPLPKPQEQVLNFLSMGTECQVRLDEEHRFTLNHPTNESVAQVWRLLSSDKYVPVINDCLKLRRDMQLCDWAYLKLLDDMTATFCGKGTNEATMLMAYIFCQSGYKMRLAFDKHILEMLYASRHSIYNISYWNIDGYKFYPYRNPQITNLNVCKAQFKGEQSMSLIINNDMSIAKNISKERVMKSERYKDMVVRAKTNKNLIDFYNTYPDSEVNNDFGTRWAMYANTPISENLSETLYKELRNQITGKDELQAVEELLNWVQTAFIYKYDNEVWGRDRAFFPEETIYYPYCDCEDRSILFSRIVRDLIGLDVVLIYYPGHLATAVHFPTDVNGDYVMINGKRYIIADPTYIGASVGRTMPKMDNAAAKVILLQ